MAQYNRDGANPSGQKLLTSLSVSVLSQQHQCPSMEALIRLRENDTQPATPYTGARATGEAPL
jgi:hypothetical protein